MGRGGWVVHLDAINPTASIHGHFALSPVLLETRNQDGGPANLTIEIYDLTVCEQSTEEKLWDKYYIRDKKQYTAGLANSSYLIAAPCVTM